jgi:hypothetical protein
VETNIAVDAKQRGEVALTSLLPLWEKVARFGAHLRS